MISVLNGKIAHVDHDRLLPAGWYMIVSYKVPVGDVFKTQLLYCLLEKDVDAHASA